MTYGEGIFACLPHRKLAMHLVWEVGFLRDDEIVTHEAGGGEEVHEECLGTIVGIDEMAVFEWFSMPVPTQHHMPAFGLE